VEVHTFLYKYDVTPHFYVTLNVTLTIVHSKNLIVVLANNLVTVVA